MKRIVLLCLPTLILAAGCGTTSPPAAEHHDRVQPPITIRGEGVRIAPFGAPSLVAFVASYPISAIVEGDVVATTAHVSPDQNIVTTTTAVVVRRALGIREGRIEAVEPGGIVPLREVRSHFEGKQGVKPLTEADLNRLVDFKMAGDAHSKVGQHVVMFLYRSKASEPWTAATKLIQSANGLTYEWPEGEAPNPRWAASYTLSQIASFLKG